MQIFHLKMSEISSMSLTVSALSETNPNKQEKTKKQDVFLQQTFWHH